MFKKYTTPADSSSESSVLTSDVYLAAYLLTQQCRIADVLKNDRRRVSFVVAGEGVADLRRAYRRGPVRVNISHFRDILINLRRRMDTNRVSGKQRSAVCPNSPVPHPGKSPAGSPIALSRA